MEPSASIFKVFYGCLTLKMETQDFLENSVTIHQSVRRNVRVNSTLCQYCRNLNYYTTGELLCLQIRLLGDKLFLDKLTTEKYPFRTSHGTWKSATVNEIPSLDPTLCQMNTIYMLFIYLRAIFFFFFTFFPTYRYQVSIDALKAAKSSAVHT